MSENLLNYGPNKHVDYVLTKSVMANMETQYHKGPQFFSYLSVILDMLAFHFCDCCLLKDGFCNFRHHIYIHDRKKGKEAP
jgi:hypothetical protein